MRSVAGNDGKYNEPAARFTTEAPKRPVKKITRNASTPVSYMCGGLEGRVSRALRKVRGHPPAPATTVRSFRRNRFQTAFKKTATA